VAVEGFSDHPELDDEVAGGPPARPRPAFPARGKAGRPRRRP
jgi:hypothetical protein